MEVYYILSYLKLLCTIVSTSQNDKDYNYYVESDFNDLKYLGNIHFSSEDIPISASKRAVYKEIWFRYILELASRFGNRKNIPEIFLHLQKNVRKAHNWCESNMDPNYTHRDFNDTFKWTREVKEHQHLPCGNIIIDERYKGYIHTILLPLVNRAVKYNSIEYAEFGINFTIHSLKSTTHYQYLTGHYRETSCAYADVAIVYGFFHSGTYRFATIKRCGEIQRENFIFHQRSIVIQVGRLSSTMKFQLIAYYQPVNLGYYVYAASTKELNVYNSTSTFYPNLRSPLADELPILYVYLIRWRIKAIIGQTIDLELYRLSSCNDDIEAVSIYDGPVKVFDQVVCTFNKEPTDPTASQAQTQSTVQLVSYRSTFTSKINYCLNIFRYSNIFFMFDVQTMASTKIHMEHDQKYQLQIASGANPIYYRSWHFTSDFFILLELTALRQFGGYEHECLYGGMVLNDIGNPLDLQYGSICTTYQGYEPLFSTTSWYFNRHGGVLTVYAFHNYFTIDIDLMLTSQLCEGITNICSTHCM